jgi:hypothetical protein
VSTWLSLLRTARAALDKKLTFGDESQIQAMRLVERIYSLAVPVATIKNLRPCESRWGVFECGLYDRCWDYREPVPLLLIEEINGPKDVAWVLARLPAPGTFTPRPTRSKSSGSPHPAACS